MLIEMWKLSKCFGECMGNFDLHIVTTLKMLGKWFVVYIYKYNIYIIYNIYIYIYFVLSANVSKL